MLFDRPLTFFLILLLYVLILFVLKIGGFKRRVYSKTCNNCCPKCDKSLVRVRRNYYDHCINYFTFYIFNFKKFSCNECKWIGLKTECANLGKVK